jgi:Ca2+-binding EF-hand superfamily protein
MKTLLIVSLAAATLAAPAFAQDAPMGPGMMFETLDADKDGNVTQAEIDAAKTARFAKADANADGKLDEAELLAQAQAMQAEHMAAMMERMQSEMPKRIAHMMIDLDTNADGFITPDEMQDDRMGKMFERLDANGDGSISTEEAAAMRGNMHDRMGERMGDHDGKGHHGWFGNWFGPRN